MQTFLVLCPLISSKVYSFVSAIVEGVEDVGDLEGVVGGSGQRGASFEMG